MGILDTIRNPVLNQQPTATPSASSPTPSKPNDQSEQLDPGVIKMAQAIRKTESNDNFNAVGDQGTSKGAYQFHNDHFERWAKEFGLDPTDFSPTNQNKVAYYKIKAMKDAGRTPDEVAAIWNGAHLDNGKYVANNPDYPKKVKRAYDSLAPTPPPLGTLPIDTKPVTPVDVASDSANPNTISNDYGGAVNFGLGVGKGIGQRIDDAGNFVVGGAGKILHNKFLQDLASNKNPDYATDEKSKSQKAGVVVGGKVLPALGGVSAGVVGAGSALSAAGLDVPSAISSLGKSSKGLLTKLIPKTTLGKLATGYALDKVIPGHPIKGVLKYLLEL